MFKDRTIEDVVSKLDLALPSSGSSALRAAPCRKRVSELAVSQYAGCSSVPRVSGRSAALMTAASLARVFSWRSKRRGIDSGCPSSPDPWRMGVAHFDQPARDTKAFGNHAAQHKKSPATSAVPQLPKTRQTQDEQP